MNHLQALTEILLMSFALGMDALSLSIGIGLGNINHKTALQLCFSIGVFHVILTLAGLVFGNLVGYYLGGLAQWFGALLLMGLGAHMLYSSLFGKEETLKPIGNAFAMTLFSASVSLDALSVGFSLGLRSATYGVVSAMSFGCISMLMCATGLFIGKKFSGSVGRYGEILGAFVLIGCGLNFLF
ncbi:manganese efflux pump MntP family protein [Alicyclobacillus fastidiosus]|uniref:Manganese efflux pump MntP family protein n=1 Tax=Alicyclobacillus fastidiosus TaxID=392011 RepID=A0ABY6ZG09_9BACL|nr:manganese efflux pump [Alicyclobacillus fastidiosus]WAH41850.1 manganese efflux pump MntP family protein [Alicyclobacillus fastidiosus]GMA63554.1 putative manganese efflux pump MntP [Alicyclobacillus fastidiosus]